MFTLGDNHLSPLGFTKTHKRLPKEVFDEAYEVEHAVDLDTDIVVSTTVHTGTAPDTATIIDTAIDAAANAEQAGADNEIEAIVADKGYHSTKVVTLAADLGMRAYIPERASPQQRRWVDKDPKEKRAVYSARRRTKSERGEHLCGLRSELTERSFAYVCDTGGARRTSGGGPLMGSRWHVVGAGRNLLLAEEDRQTVNATPP